MTTISSFINAQRNIVKLGTTYNLTVPGYRCGNIAICINLTTKKRDGVNLELNLNTVINEYDFFQKNKHFLLKVVQLQERPGEEASDDKETNSSKHESIACGLESKKQYCLHLLGHSPTAFV